MLDRKHYNVYKLIYERFIASQMKEALYDSMQVEIANGDYDLKASGKALKFAGYTAVWQDSKPAKGTRTTARGFSRPSRRDIFWTVSASSPSRSSPSRPCAIRMRRS